MLRIEKTVSTPEVIIDETSFKITGVCTPEHPPKFFEQFEENVKKLYVTGRPVEMIFHLDYFNTGSSKCLLNLFRDMADKSDNIKVTWIYERGDDEMKESGELYAEIAEMNFNLVEK